MPLRRNATNPVLDHALMARVVKAKHELERLVGGPAGPMLAPAIEALDAMLLLLPDAAAVVAKGEMVTKQAEVTHCTHCRIVKFGRHRQDCTLARLRAHLECRTMPERTRSLPHR